jgi:uncharacterized metal-binding protein
MKARVTCSVLSNTGRLTTQLAMIPASRCPGTIAWVQANKGEHGTAGVTNNADQIIVIDGRSDHSAQKN